MGLIISVLVACVGVYEFFRLYCDTGKNYQTKETNSAHHEPVNDESKPRIKLCRDFLSHEDVEVECTSQMLRQSSASPSPRRFLVTEKDENRSSSPRKFVVSSDGEGNSNLREFLIAKGIPKDNSSTKRYVLIDTKEDFREVSPLPLPKQFVITQNKTSLSHEKLENVKQGIGVLFNSLSFQDKEVKCDQETASRVLEETVLETKKLPDYQYTKFDTQHSWLKSPNNTHGSEISTSLYELYSPEPAEFHRDPSPYPGLDVFARRGSLTSELLENPKTGIVEIDEEAYNTQTKIDVILKSSNFNTTEYWSNKILVEPSRRYKSGSHTSISHSDRNDDSVNSVDQQHLKIDHERTRSKSATRKENLSSVSHMRKISSSSRIFDKDLQVSSGLFKDVLERGRDEGFRNSLDGIKKGNEARRSFKRKKNKSQNSLEHTHEYYEGKNKRVQGQKDGLEKTWVNTKDM